MIQTANTDYAAGYDANYEKLIKIGKLIENQKSGLKSEIRFSVLKTGFRIYFWKSIFLSKIA